MRAAVMRPSATDAGCADSAVGAMSKLLENSDFRGYISSPSVIGCDLARES
jgi:hypothetical protein